MKSNDKNFLNFAIQLLIEDSNKYDPPTLYNLLFDEIVSYDNAQRQIKGIRTFLNKYINELNNETIEEITNHQIDLSINGDGTQTRNALLYLEENQIKNPKLLLEAHGYDYNLFELVNSKNSMWHQKSNTSGLSTLYCSKITVKPRNTISLEQIEEIFQKIDRQYKDKKKEKNNIKNKKNNESFVLNFFDVHFAKLAHIEETGNEYNYKIAKKRMLDSVHEYMNRFSNRHFENIYFAIGQDYFNSEPTGNTVGNTKQDNDCRYSVMFEEGVSALIDIIDELRKICDKIYIPLVQGNHSTYTEYYAAQFLKAWYKNDKDVIIDASVLPRKYYSYGVNLFGFTHNSEEKDRIYNLMQVEAPQMWANTLERTWFTGHLHSEDVKEKGGCYIRQAPTLCGTDAWHKRTGYVNPIKRTQGFIYDKDNGLRESHYVIVK